MDWGSDVRVWKANRRERGGKSSQLNWLSGARSGVDAGTHTHLLSFAETTGREGLAFWCGGGGGEVWKYAGT